MPDASTCTALKYVEHPPPSTSQLDIRLTRRLFTCFGRNKADTGPEALQPPRLRALIEFRLGDSLTQFWARHPDGLKLELDLDNISGSERHLEEALVTNPEDTFKRHFYSYQQGQSIFIRCPMLWGETSEWLDYSERRWGTGLDWIDTSELNFSHDLVSLLRVMAACNMNGAVEITVFVRQDSPGVHRALSFLRGETKRAGGRGGRFQLPPGVQIPRRVSMRHRSRRPLPVPRLSNIREEQSQNGGVDNGKKTRSTTE